MTGESNTGQGNREINFYDKGQYVQGGQHIQGDFNLAEEVRYGGGNVSARDISGGNLTTRGDTNNDGSEQQQTQQALAEIAKEIQALLEKLDKTHPTDTQLGQMKVATQVLDIIQEDMSLTDRIIRAVTAGGVEALKQFLSHPAASFVITLIDDLQKTKQPKAIADRKTDLVAF